MRFVMFYCEVVFYFAADGDQLTGYFHTVAVISLSANPTNDPDGRTCHWRSELWTAVKANICPIIFTVQEGKALGKTYIAPP